MIRLRTAKETKLEKLNKLWGDKAAERKNYSNKLKLW